MATSPVEHPTSCKTGIAYLWIYISVNLQKFVISLTIVYCCPGILKWDIFAPSETFGDVLEALVVISRRGHYWPLVGGSQ